MQLPLLNEIILDQGQQKVGLGSVVDPDPAYSGVKMCVEYFPCISRDNLIYFISWISRRISGLMLNEENFISMLRRQTLKHLNILKHSQHL